MLKSAECFDRVNCNVKYNRLGELTVKYYPQSFLKKKKNYEDVKDIDSLVFLYNRQTGERVPFDVEKDHARLKINSCKRKNVPSDSQVFYQRRFDKKLESYRKVYDICNNNRFTAFITLTYKVNEKDLNLAKKHFNSWRTIISREYPDFKYVAVPEFQKRGAVHFHILCNLDVTCEVIESLRAGKFSVRYWKHGFSDVRFLNGINNVGKYISKYMLKSDETLQYMKHMYLSSHGLLKSFSKDVYVSIDELKYCLEQLAHPIFSLYVNEKKADNCYIKQYYSFSFNLKTDFDIDLFSKNCDFISCIFI